MNVAAHPFPPASAPSRAAEVVTLGVIVPAHQAEAYLPRCIDGLRAAGFDLGACLLVDDRSQDAGPEIARAAGMRVETLPTGSGASAARNYGVALLEKDVVVFVDADVVMKPGAAARIARAFEERPDLDALFGSYDDAPPASGVVSRYRNLLHHHVHQSADGEARTFWTGCGAVRRAVFRRLGGFDAATESVEDVDLGLRLSGAGGRILLDKGLLCTHLKRWSLLNMLRTDYGGRAVPWSRMLFFRHGHMTDLNLSGGHRRAALLALSTVGGLVVAPFWPPAALGALLALSLFVANDAGLFRLLHRRGGMALSAAGTALHVAHYLCAAAGMARVVFGEVIPSRLGLARARG